MASTSDPPAAGGGDEASVPTETAVAPSAEAPPPPLLSSKRRWSPCTWRYAIEEAQPELASRPRSGSSNVPHSSPSVRAAFRSDHAALPVSVKSRSLHSQDHAIFNRAWPGAELSELRARHAPPRTHETTAKNRRPPHPQQPHRQHQQQKEPAKRLNEEEEKDDEDEWDDDDANLGYHFEDSKKRKRRAISPSERYFCDICRAKAAEVPKNGGSPDSQLPLQDS